MNILIVEDDQAVREFLVDLLGEIGEHLVLAAASASEALELVSNGLDFDLLLTDQVMPGGSGGELIAALRRRGCRQPMYVLTGLPALRSVPEADGILRKPVRYETLAAILSSRV